MRRIYAIALTCLMAAAVLSAIWIGGRGHEVPDPNTFGTSRTLTPNAVRTRPTVSPFPTVEFRPVEFQPLRVDVEQRTISALPITESVSNIEPLADVVLLDWNNDTDSWELRDQNGAHLETLAIPTTRLRVLPGARGLAYISKDDVIVYDWQARSTRTVAQLYDEAGTPCVLCEVSTYVLWSNEGNRFAVFSRRLSTNVRVVRTVDGAVVAEKTWADGESVWLFEWTPDEALRVMVWAQGAPYGPNTLLELDDSGVTDIEEKPEEASYYCGPDINSFQCVVGDDFDLSTSEELPENRLASVPSPDGLYVAILARASTYPFDLYLRLLSTQDDNFSDLPVPNHDESIIPTWSLDSRFVYLSRHVCRLKLQPQAVALTHAATQGRIPGC